MTISATPIALVSLSACFYALLARAVREGGRLPPAAQNRAISAGHAALVAFIALYVVRQPQWSQPAERQPANSPQQTERAVLDDSANPLIQGRSQLGNAITAFEAGYVLYDTWAMASCYPGRGPFSRLVAAARASPVMMWHHVLLAVALLWLQTYIARGRERGIWVIMALLLMNASNPLLHLRWWRRKAGKDSTALDISFAAAFALTRFATLAWVLRLYGAYHRIGPLEAFSRLRTPCKAGTATLTGLNGAWWVLLVSGIIARSSRAQPRAAKAH